MTKENIINILESYVPKFEYDGSNVDLEPNADPAREDVDFRLIFEGCSDVDEESAREHFQQYAKWNGLEIGDSELNENGTEIVFVVNAYPNETNSLPNPPPLLYQNVKDRIVLTEGNKQERIAKLKDLVSYSETLCALAEMKENAYNDLVSKDQDLNWLDMANAWELLMNAAISFEEGLEGVEWDGEWYECCEQYFTDIVYPRLLLQN
jgi:hypothetical protein